MTVLRLLFALLTFFSAFLLFQIQPLISRVLLPLFGGSSAVWTTCILFFQAVLLGGYFLAYALDRYLQPRLQPWAYLGLLGISLLLLHGLSVHAIEPPASPDAPVPDILRTLALTVGFPYLVLSATSPLLQAWFRNSSPGRMPYWLYSVSNIGSLLALLSYPLAIEPLFGLEKQMSIWACCFLGYAVLVCSLIFFLRLKDSAPVLPEPGTLGEISAIRFCGWLFFPAASSVLLLGFTQYITYDVSPMPLLWVIPLSVYLLSFVICFREKSRYSRQRLFPVLIGMDFFFSGDFVSGASAPILFNFCFCVFSLLVCCVICHAELYRLRPKPEKLALFYVTIAFGSAVGSIFSAIIAPRIFSSFLEVPVGLLVLLFVYAAVLTRQAEPVFPKCRRTGLLSERNLVWCFCFWALIWFWSNQRHDKSIIYRERNFYGTLAVVDSINQSDPRESHRRLVNGRILHGAAYLDPELELLPVAYYGANSALAPVFQWQRRKPGLRIGAIGLGTGACAAWGRDSDYVRYYEINPAVPPVARRFFAYLDKTPAKKDIVLGDARLTLQQEAPQNYDVLIVDAFSSDAIPFHLLTVEAFQLYLKHLEAGGLIALHVTNRHLQLEPVALSIARALKLHAAVFTASNENASTLETYSSYVIMSRADEFFKQESVLKRATPLKSSMMTAPLWTDDYASTLEVIRFWGTIRSSYEEYLGAGRKKEDLGPAVIDAAQFSSPSR